MKSQKKVWAALFALVVVGVVTSSYVMLHPKVPNGATVQTNSQLLASGPLSKGTVCSASTGMYATSLALTWNEAATGTRLTRFVCIQNVSPSDYHVNMATGLSAGYGRLGSPQSGQNLVTGGFLLVEIDWSIPADAPLGPLSFNISFV